MRYGAQCDFFQLKCENILDMNMGSEFHDYIAYINFTTIFSPLFCLLVILFQEMSFMNVKAERTKESNDEQDRTLYSKYKES